MFKNIRKQRWSDSLLRKLRNGQKNSIKNAKCKGGHTKASWVRLREICEREIKLIANRAFTRTRTPQNNSLSRQHFPKSENLSASWKMCKIKVALLQQQDNIMNLLTLFKCLSESSPIPLSKNIWRLRHFEPKIRSKSSLESSKKCQKRRHLPKNRSARLRKRPQTKFSPTICK